MGLEFEVGRNEHEQPQYRKHRLSDGPAHTDTIRYDWRDIRCKDEPSAGNYQPLLARGRIYKSPSGSRPVSISVGCQGLSRVGA